MGGISAHIDLSGFLIVMYYGRRMLRFSLEDIFIVLPAKNIQNSWYHPPEGDFMISRERLIDIQV